MIYKVKEVQYATFTLTTELSLTPKVKRRVTRLFTPATLGGNNIA